MLMQQTTGPDVQTWQGVITLALFLVAFGALGWRRGYRRELAALLGIFIGYKIWTTPLGDKVVSYVNQFGFMGLVALKAGFDPQKMFELAANPQGISPLISPERKEAFLFFAFLFMVMLGYGAGYLGCCIGSLLRRLLDSPPSLVGFILGAINGYLLIIWLFPTLIMVLPTAQPGVVAARAAEEPSTRSLILEGVKEFAGVLGLEPGQLLVAFVGLGVLWVAWKSR